MSAGEASGDMHGADLVRELLSRAPGAELFGMGGPMMRDAGVELLFNPASMSTVGFVESLRSVHVLRRVLQRLGDAMDQRRPDVLVCVDFPGFNMRLAEMAHRRGIPVVYYFAPTVWAWGRGRADKLARLGVVILSVFPFEAEAYARAGAEVEFVGHPLVDRVRPAVSRDEARRELGVAPDEILVALLPGSREQELRQLLLPMMDAATRIRQARPSARFALPVAHTLTARSVSQLAGPGAEPPVIIVEGRTYDVLNAADAALISMGTATLEAALLGVPHVACYKLSAATFQLAKRLVRIPHKAMPNILAGRRIVPELLQGEASGERMARELLAMLEPERAAEVRRALAEVRPALGEPGAAGRAAEAVLARAGRAGMA